MVILIAQLEATLLSLDAELYFYNNPTDSTQYAIERAADAARPPVQSLHREETAGHLAGAAMGLALVQGALAVVGIGD